MGLPRDGHMSASLAPNDLPQKPDHRRLHRELPQFRCRRCKMHGDGINPESSARGDTVQPMFFDPRQVEACAIRRMQPGAPKSLFAR